MISDKSTIIMTKKDARAILFWLNTNAKEKWISGSLSSIEHIYNDLNKICNYPETPRKWKWKPK